MYSHYVLIKNSFLEKNNKKCLNNLCLNKKIRARPGSLSAWLCPNGCHYLALRNLFKSAGDNSILFFLVPFWQITVVF